MHFDVTRTLIAMSLTLCAHAHALPLGPCSLGDRAACDRLAGELAGLVGRDATGQELAWAAARIVARTSDDTLVGAAVRRCRDGEAASCDQLGEVLNGLFTGADARLDRSDQRALAHALAEAIVTESTENQNARLHRGRAGGQCFALYPETHLQFAATAH
jgi:hypothetical protein